MLFLYGILRLVNTKHGSCW